MADRIYATGRRKESTARVWITPGTGEINYPFLYGHLDRIGYAGWVGAEYKPKAGTVEGLGWFKEVSAKRDAA